MSVFLTPTLQPFLGGTYFPPADAYGRPGFATVLKRITEVWQTKRNEILAQSANVMSQLEAAMSSEGAQSSFEHHSFAGAKACVTISLRRETEWLST